MNTIFEAKLMPVSLGDVIVISLHLDEDQSELSDSHAISSMANSQMGLKLEHTPSRGKDGIYPPPVIARIPVFVSVVKLGATIGIKCRTHTLTDDALLAINQMRGLTIDCEFITEQLAFGDTDMSVVLKHLPVVGEGGDGRGE